jgi:2-methylcitrate dehydratase PrpD
VRALAALAHEVDASALAPEVVARSLDVVMDTVGSAVFGSADGFLSALRTSMLAACAPGPATIFGTATTADAGWAAFFNAAACTTTQFDEGHRTAIGHPGIHVALPALAVAEQEDLPGLELIAAVTAGYEVAVRIGHALGRLRPGLHAHGHWPVIGGAVAVAKLLGADEAGLVAAIEGAATLTLYPTEQTTTDGTSVHHYYAGLGALIAVGVGHGAAAGMTASDGTLAGHLAELSSGRFDREALAGTPTGTFHVLDNYFKLQPVCAHAITTIEAVDSLLPEITPAAPLRRARVRTYAYAAALSDRAPRTSLAAKFSIPFVIAARLTAGASGAALHDVELEDPDLRELMAKVDVVLDPELDLQYPERRAAGVELEFEDGTILRATRDMPLGDSANPVSPERLQDKFRDLTRARLGGDRVDPLLEHPRELPRLSSIRRLTALTRPDQGRNH